MKRPRQPTPGPIFNQRGARVIILVMATILLLALTYFYGPPQ